MKILFPQDSDWKLARLIQRDNEYVIQTRWNEDKQKHEIETVVSKDTECAELVAFNLYTDLLNKAVTDKLQRRENYKNFCEEHFIKKETTNDEKCMYSRKQIS